MFALNPFPMGSVGMLVVHTSPLEPSSDGVNLGSRPALMLQLEFLGHALIAPMEFGREAPALVSFPHMSMFKYSKL